MSSKKVTIVKDREFAKRFAEACGTDKPAEIARKYSISYHTAMNYLDGRLPTADMLRTIRTLTSVNIDWLLTGEGPKGLAAATNTAAGVSKKLDATLRTIAREQAEHLFGDADIAGTNREEATLSFLTEFLLHRALVIFNLATDDEMPAKDRKRAERFTFVANRPQSLDDRIRELVRQEASGTFDEGRLRAIMREIVREEVQPKRPVFNVDLGDKDKKTRKAG